MSTGIFNIGIVGKAWIDARVDEWDNELLDILRKHLPDAMFSDTLLDELRDWAEEYRIWRNLSEPDYGEDE